MASDIFELMRINAPRLTKVYDSLDQKDKNDYGIINFFGNEMIGFRPVTYQQSNQIAEGVNCDSFIFDGENGIRDLAIIRISPGKKTPWQKVVEGDETVEGYIKGKGVLTVLRKSGEKMVYWVSGDHMEVKTGVWVGDVMQWRAEENSELEIYEICYPPYEEGRFKIIDKE